MRASSWFLLALLRTLCGQAGLTLKDALDAASTAVIKESGTGKFVSYSSINGQSVTFTIPAGSGLNPNDIAEAYEFLYLLYEKAVCAAGDPQPDDAVLCSTMKHALLTNTGTRLHDFSATTYR